MARVCQTDFDPAPVAGCLRETGAVRALASALSTVNFALFANGGSGKHGDPRGLSRPALTHFPLADR